MRLEDKLILPNTFCYLKDTVCKFDNCISGGVCEICKYGLLRSYASRDSARIGKLMNKVSFLEEANKKLRKELSDTKTLNKVLAKEMSFFKTENSTLNKGLAECCDRLWYYFGEIGGTWSNLSCKNVYDTAKYYLGRARKGEDDGGQY